MPQQPCEFHSDLVEGQATIIERVDNLNENIDRLNRIIIGNGHEGLITKVGKLSLVAGSGSAIAMLVIVALFRHLFTI